MASVWVIEGAEHDDDSDILEVGGLPEVVIVLYRSLTKDSEYVPINERPDLIGINIVVGDVFQFNSAVLV